MNDQIRARVVLHPLNSLYVVIFRIAYPPLLVHQPVIQDSGHTDGVVVACGHAPSGCHPQTENPEVTTVVADYGVPDISENAIS